METKVITMASHEFGTVRKIKENGVTLYCATDIAKSLGYAKPNNAISAHCRYTLKRGTPHPQSKNKTIEMSFIPEGDVWRLICHSKLPNAEQFEKWIFDDVVPTVTKTGKYEIPKQPAQMTLREIEHERIKCVLKATGYSYYEKTYNGEPVISLKDVAYYTGIATETAIAALRKHGKYGKDYFKVDHAKMASFKDENRNVPACYTHLILVTRSGFILLAELYGIDKNVFGCFTQTESEKPVPQKPTVDELIIALNVLRYTKHNNRKCAELVGGVDEYSLKVDGAIETVRKRIGMMLTV